MTDLLAQRRAAARRSTPAREKRRMGWDLAEARDPRTMPAVYGVADDAAMRQLVIRMVLPDVGPHIHRYMREGWNAQRAGKERP